MLNCVDLFAGAGGFSLGARRAGLNIRLAIENNSHAAQTYRSNICRDEHAPIVLEVDISTLDPEKLFVETFGREEPCDIMLGGPPCQGFSTHRIKNSGVRDGRNDLIHVYFEFVKTFSPSIFLMENVPGMLWPRHKASLDRFYLEGGLAGYDIQQPVIIDARDYGIHQRRKRVFILGLRQGLSLQGLKWPPSPTHGSPAACLKDSNLEPWTPCDTAFLPAHEGDPNDVHMQHSQLLIEAFNRTPLNGGSRKDSGRTLPCHLNHDGHKDVYGRIDPAWPAPTMTTACINPSKGRFVHPSLPHGITVRQAARLQTFPDDYLFSGGLIASGQQVGNAVPVKLSEILIKHLTPILLHARARRIKHVAGYQLALTEARELELGRT